MYRVYISLQTSEGYRYDVEADNEDEAKRMVQDMLDNDEIDYDDLEFDADGADLDIQGYVVADVIELID